MTEQPPVSPQPEDPHDARSDRDRAPDTSDPGDERDPLEDLGWSDDDGEEPDGSPRTSPTD